MTSNDLKLKQLQKYGFMYIKWKPQVTGNVKIAIEYIIDLLVTPKMNPNDIKIETNES